MSSPLPLLAVIACIVYALVSALCLRAAGQASRSGMPAGERQLWICLAMFFLAVLVWRAAGMEDALREAIREWMRLRGTYDLRRTFQGPLAAVTVLAGAALAFHFARRLLPFVPGRRSSWTNLALLCAGAMMALMLARLVSFHALDWFLYSGPHLNWLIDMGSSVLSALAAVRYQQLAAAPDRARGPRPPGQPR